jgi:nitrite reductase/ring-hydroxylating ferredoxin subunit
MENLNRREFLIGSLACSACALCPAKLHAADPKPVDIGTPADFAKEGITDTWAYSHDFFIVRRKNVLYAVSATCTHKSFDLVSDKGTIKCPKHGSIFSLEGKTQKGPARASLPRLAITRIDSGRIIVDPSKKFSEKNWSDPASFINL